jgi:SAM-dependent methyltransferase
MRDADHAESAGRVAIVGELPSDSGLSNALARAVAPLRLSVLAGTRTSPGRLAYRTSRLGLIVAPAAMPAAVAIQRIARIPWVAIVSADMGRGSLGRKLLEQAAAVVVADASVDLSSTPRLRRVIPAADEERLRAVLGDIVLAADARPNARTALAAFADAWAFANDRAGRAATRLVPLTGKATQPVHPKHLIGVPWHTWYVDELEPWQRVADLGCGNGAHALQVAAHVASVVGVDVDGAELARAAACAADAGIENVQFVRGDLTAPETLATLGESSFDVVVALDVVEHLVDREGFLRAATRLLAPGGKLLISVPNRDTPYKQWRRRIGAFAYVDPDHKVEYTEESLESELSASGLTIRRIERAGYDTPFGGLTALVGAFSIRAYRLIATRRQRLSLRRPAWATAFRVVAQPRQDGESNEA